MLSRILFLLIVRRSGGGSAVSLVSSTLDMNSGLLSLDFSSKVRSATLSATGIQFFSSRQSNDTAYKLTGMIEDVFPESNSSTTVSLMFLDVDYLNLLWRRDDSIELEDAAVVGVSPSQPFLGLVTSIVEDAFPPSIFKYALDMDAGTLDIRFDEPMNSSSIDLSKIVLQSASSTNDAVASIALHRIKAEQYSSTLEESMWINVSLGAENLNLIKANPPVATSYETTWLAVTARGAATDLSGNLVTTSFWTIYEGQPPFSWVGDTTAPELEAFELDLNYGHLQLRFTETIDAAELRVWEIKLVAAATGEALKNASSSVTLRGTTDSGSRLVSWDDAEVVEIALSAIDLNEIKATLAHHLESTKVTFVGHESFRDNAIPPNYGNASSSRRALGTFVPDTTKPSLLSWSLDLDQRQLHLHFDEIVNATSLDVSMLGLQSAERYAVAGVRTIQLTSRSTYATTESATIITLNLGREDFGKIKLDVDIATFLTMRPSALVDMTGNGNFEVSIYQARRVDKVVSDVSAPLLLRWGMDMNSSILSLVFNEPVARDSLKLSSVTIRGGKAVEDVPQVALTAMSPSYADGDQMMMVDEDLSVSSESAAEILFVLLPDADINALKLQDGVADTILTSWIQTSQGGWVADFPDYNAIEEVYTDFLADAFNADTTRPTLTSFTLDLDSATLTLHADEPLRSSEMNASFFQVTSRRDALGINLGLSELSTQVRPPVSGVSIRLELHRDEADFVKTDDWFGDPDRPRWLSHKALYDEDGGGARDMSGNVLNAIVAFENASIPCIVTYPDLSPPILLSFDMIDDNITMRFNEPVQPGRIRDDESWLVQSARFVTSGAVPLRELRASYSYLTRRDLFVRPSLVTRRTLSTRGDVSTGQSNTYLRASSPNGIFDHAGNGMELMEEALQLGPSILAFELDANLGTIRLEFSEPVDFDTFRPNSLTLQSAATNGGEERLILDGGETLGEVVRGSYSSTLLVTLSEDDIEKIRLSETLARGVDRTWLVAAEDVISDFDRNRLALSWNSLQAAAVFPDTTRPTFLSCSLDMDAAILTLRFDEPVRASSLIQSKVQLKSSQQGADEAVELTTSQARRDGATLTIDLSTHDAASIKTMTQLATTPNATWCALEAHAVADCGAGTSSQSESATSRAGLERVDTLAVDTTPPTLILFSLDLDAQEIHLHFDEPVNASNPVQVSTALASDQSIEASTLSLVCSRISSRDFSYNATTTISLCPTDSQALFSSIASGGICSSLDKCFLFFGSRLAYDTSYNAALSVDLEYAIQASNIVPDTTAPVINAFSLDLEYGVLTLFVNEVVDASSTQISLLTVQSARFNDGVGTRTLSEENGTFVGRSSSSNMTVVEVELGRDDLDALKALSGAGLGLSRTSVYISFGHGLLRDVSGNPTGAVESFAGIGPASDFTQDQSAPRLLSFSSVSQTRKILYALFDEPVDHDNVNLSQWSLGHSRFLALDDQSSGVTVLTPGVDPDAALPADHNAPYSTTLALRLNDAFANVQALGALVSQETTRLRLLDYAVWNTALSNPRPFRNEILTQTGPKLEAAALDMNAGLLALAFTEKIASNESLDVSAISLHSSRNEDAATVVLSQSSKPVGTALLGNVDARLYSAQLLLRRIKPFREDGDRVIVVELTEKDAWALQRGADQLANRRAFVSISSFFGYAPSNTAILGDPLSVVECSRTHAIEVGWLREDSTPPILLSYALDMNVGRLRFNFSEPINEKSFNLSAFTLLPEIQGKDGVRLGGDSWLDRDDREGNLRATCDDARGNWSTACSYIFAAFGPRDFDLVRAIKAGNSLVFEANAARDTAFNQIKPAALTVGAFVKDTTPPILISVEMDLDGGILTMNFSEPVDPLTFNASLVHFRNNEVLNTSRQVLRLQHTRTTQIDGSRSLNLRLQKDLNRLKVYLALNSQTASIGKENSTFVDVGTNFVQDCAYPSPANPAAATVRSPDLLIPDATGPRLLSFDFSADYAWLRLYFDEPILANTVNVSALIFVLGENDTVRLVVSAGIVVVEPFRADVPLLASNHEQSALRASSSSVRIVQPFGGVVLDVIGGVPAVPGVGPYIVDDNFESSTLDGIMTGLTTSSAMLIGPVVTSFVLDMENAQLRIEFNHDINPFSLNVSALSIAASDDSSSISYALANGSVVVDVEEYGTNGNAGVTIALSANDVNALKLANGGSGESPVATRLSNTILSVSPEFATSPYGTRCVPRLLGAPLLSGVKSLEFVADTTSPKLIAVEIDMNAGRLSVFMDEPVRAGQVDVAKFTLFNKNMTTSYALSSTSSRTLNTGASATIVLEIGETDLNELKRLDGIATSRRDTFLVVESDAVVDRSAEANGVGDALNPHAVRKFGRDVTPPSLLFFDADFEGRSLTLYFDEPVVNFNASALTLQETNLAEDGQYYQLVSSFALSTNLPSQIVVVVIEDEDYSHINLETRLAKNIDATRLRMTSLATEDVAGNQVRGIFDGQTMTASNFLPDSTKPEMSRFWIDMNSGTLTLNFTEPVAFETLDSAMLVLDDSADTSFAVLSATPLAAAGSAGEELTLSMSDSDMNDIKAIRTLAVDIESVFLSANQAVADMSGNLLLESRRSAAFYIPDSTPPSLEAFDLDMNTGVLLLDFTETVDMRDVTGLQLMAGPSLWKAGGAVLSGDTVTSTGETPDVLQLVLDLMTLNRLKMAKVGVVDTFLAMDAKTVSDTVGLAVVRVTPGDIVGGNPMRVRSLTRDDENPSLLRATYSTARQTLHLFFDEPISKAEPSLFQISSDGTVSSSKIIVSEEMPIITTEFKTEVVLQLLHLEDEMCPTNGSNTCGHDVEDASTFYVVAEEGAVSDYAGNPSLALPIPFETKPPDCTCGENMYISVECTDTSDVVCTACSSECAEPNHFIKSPCSERSDIGCQECSSCGYPYFPSDPCSGDSDTTCAPCAECKPMEYEASACGAGHDRVCVSCALDRECENPSEQCRDAAMWWRLANCCKDADGVQVACNDLVRANARITARESRRHWVFDSTYPQVEPGYTLEDVLSTGG